jgi:DNA (cytosine-5)-methyltransferase 1
MNHFSLFTGIGGIDLAAEWAGFQTVGQCEWADYPTKVLEKHWPNVPRWRDVRDVTADSFRERTGLSTVDLISGGFPCQPFSIAGERRGKEDDRYLWPEMLIVISELRPTWVLGENVAGIIKLALDDVLSSLKSIGYSTQAFVIPACAVNADHRRDRVFIVAYTGGKGLEGIHETSDRVEMQLSSEYFPGNFRKATPRVLRRNHGIPNWMDRIKCLGNAVVPQQVYPILKAIAEAIKREGSC